MKLSPNFTLQELTQTSTGLPNEPKPEHLPRLIALAATLEKVRSLFNRPIIVSSGYRSDAVNTKVGGSKTSAHSLGYAADFTVKGLSVREVCEKIVQSNINFDQIIDEKRGNTTWIHLSIDPRMRGQVLTFRNGTYTQGLT